VQGGSPARKATRRMPAAAAKARGDRGAANRRLSDADVLFIRSHARRRGIVPIAGKWFDLKQVDLAREYRVVPRTIAMIVGGQVRSGVCPEWPACDGAGTPLSPV